MVFAGSGKLVPITVEGCSSTAGSSGDDPGVGPVVGVVVTGGTEADGADILMTGEELEAELEGGTTAKLGVITKGLGVGVEEVTGGGICMSAKEETVGVSVDAGADETAIGEGIELDSVALVTA